MSQLRCVACGVTFDLATLPADCTDCPNCASKSVPCNPDKDVTITINWHELRILCIWAENWGRKIGTPGTVYSIAQRIEDQARKPTWAALTLQREIDEIPGAKLIDGNRTPPQVEP